MVWPTELSYFIVRSVQGVSDLLGVFRTQLEKLEERAVKQSIPEARSGVAVAVSLSHLKLGPREKKRIDYLLDEVCGLFSGSYSQISGQQARILSQIKRFDDIIGCNHLPSVYCQSNTSHLDLNADLCDSIFTLFDGSSKLFVDFCNAIADEKNDFKSFPVRVCTRMLAFMEKESSTFPSSFNKEDVLEAMRKLFLGRIAPPSTFQITSTLDLAKQLKVMVELCQEDRCKKMLGTFSQASTFASKVLEDPSFPLSEEEKMSVLKNVRKHTISLMKNAQLNILDTSELERDLKICNEIDVLREYVERCLKECKTISQVFCVSDVVIKQIPLLQPPKITTTSSSSSASSSASTTSKKASKKQQTKKESLLEKIRRHACNILDKPALLKMGHFESAARVGVLGEYVNKIVDHISSYGEGFKILSTVMKAFNQPDLNKWSEGSKDSCIAKIQERVRKLIDSPSSQLLNSQRSTLMREAGEVGMLVELCGLGIKGTKDLASAFNLARTVLNTFSENKSISATDREEVMEMVRQMMKHHFASAQGPITTPQAKTARDLDLFLEYHEGIIKAQSSAVQAIRYYVAVNGDKQVQLQFGTKAAFAMESAERDKIRSLIRDWVLHFLAQPPVKSCTLDDVAVVITGAHDLELTAEEVCKLLPPVDVEKVCIPIAV